MTEEKKPRKPRDARKDPVFMRMLEEALERVELCQRHVRAIEQACWHINDKHRHFTCNPGNLREKLIAMELEEWRAVFMWGLVVPEEARDRIRAAAHQRFLKEGISVVHWLNDGIEPSQWLVTDEDEFRALIDKAFRPRAEKLAELPEEDEEGAE